MKEENLTVRATARQLQCTTKYVFDLLYSGRFKSARKVDGRWQIPADEVRSLMRDRKARARAASTRV